MRTDDPVYLKMGDGTLIDTRTGKRTVDTEINRAFSDRPEQSMLKPGKKDPGFQQGKRRFIDELPCTPAQVKAVGVLASLTLFGLADSDTAYLLGIPIETVENIKDSEAYTEFMDAMLQNVREHDKDKVRRKINESAEKAATKITNMLESVDEKVRLSAAKDILDRASDGAYAAKQNDNNSFLTIRIMDDRDNKLDDVKVEIDG